MSTAEQPDKNQRKPITPAERARMQQWFAHGSKMAGKGEFDYATDMFTQCVQGDPGNVIYIQNFLGNLQKKYNNNKKGSKLAAIKGAGVKGAIKKAQLQKNWAAVLASGLEILKLNPWDVSALTSLAAACEQLEHDDSQLAFLKLASEVDLQDPEVNRLRGKALAKKGQFDEAIVCFSRVVKALPSDEEAKRMIGNLTVEKTIHKGKYEEAESTRDVRVENEEDQRANAANRLSPVQQLEKAIAKNPADISQYTELAHLHLKDERFEQAEEVLTRALQASGGDINLREQLEDVQLRRARGQLAVAKKRAEAERTAEAIELYKKIYEELNRKELEIYRSRCDRYPNNLGFKYEFAVRLKRAKNYNEAIKLFQEARGDAKRKGTVFLELGDCFQAIKQFKLAMNNFESAVTEIGERDMEQRKTAIYQAGRLALYMKDWPKADKYLNELAGIDFGYKDVADLLDKLSKFRDDTGPGPG